MDNRKFIKINRELTEKEINNIKRFYNIDVLDENEYESNDSRIVLNICKGSFFLGAEDIDYLISEKKYKILRSNDITKNYIYPLQTTKFIINEGDEKFSFVNEDNKIIIELEPTKKMIKFYNYLYIEKNKLFKILNKIEFLREKFVSEILINQEIKKYNSLSDRIKRDLINMDNDNFEGEK